MIMGTFLHNNIFVKVLSESRNFEIYRSVTLLPGF